MTDQEGEEVCHLLGGEFSQQQIRHQALGLSRQQSHLIGRDRDLFRIHSDKHHLLVGLQLEQSS